MHTPSLSYLELEDPPLRRWCIDGLERFAGRRSLELIYGNVLNGRPAPDEFFTQALKETDIKVEVDPLQEAKIPQDGPLLIIANHPFGVVDGMIACDIAARHRGPFKILLHSRLCRDQYLDECFLPVSFDDNREAVQLNVQTKRKALQVLKNNGTIVIFPAGAVSTRSRLGFGPLADLPWTTFAAKLALQSEATVLPLYFHGENSFAFHFVSGFSETLRLALLIAEVRNKLGATVKVDIRDPISSEIIQEFQNRKALTEFFLQQTFGAPEHLKP